MKSSWSTGFKSAKEATELSNAGVKSRKMGAALSAGGRIVSIGYNTFGKSHPEFTDIDCDGNDFLRNSHAELMALVRRKHHGAKNLVMYIYRELDDGTPANSRPCKFCMKLIKEFGVKKIRYVNDKGDYIEERLNSIEIND